MLALCLIPGRWLSAQVLTDEQAILLFGEPKALQFQYFSLDLTDDSQETLDKLVEKLRQFPAMRGRLLLIEVSSCEKELNVKPYLSTVRGQVIIDYLQRSIKYPRKRCLIQDGGPNYEDKECELAGTVKISLKPAWR
ncbi:MAG: hypothetical protein AAF206_24470 [Bacteroidota bacterium]